MLKRWSVVALSMAFCLPAMAIDQRHGGTNGVLRNP